MSDFNQNNLHWLYSEKVLVGNPIQILAAGLGIANGVIQKILPMSRQEWTQFQLTQTHTEDLGDKILSPAFVNCHTHLCMLAFRGIGGLASLEGNIVKDLYFQLEQLLEPEDVLAFTRLGALEALMHGTGMVWEHYYFGDALVQGLEDVGLCGAVASTLQDLDGPGKDLTEQAWDETHRLANDVDKLEKGIVAVLGPHATDTVSDELWLRIAESAEQNHLPIHAHLAQALDEVEWSWKHHNESPLQRMHRLGLTSLSVPRLWVHGLYIGDEELHGLNKKLDTLGHCPAAQMQFGFPAYTNAWRGQDLNVVLGTDAGSCNDGINIQSEIKFFAAADSYGVTMGDTLNKFRSNPTLQKARLVQRERQVIFDLRAPYSSAQAALSSVWDKAADLHPQAPVGIIEEGRWANLVVWDGNHPCLWPNLDILQGLAFANATPAIERIMTRGQWRYDGDGSLAHRIAQNNQVQLWQKEATQRWQALMQRANL